MSTKCRQQSGFILKEGAEVVWTCSACDYKKAQPKDLRCGRVEQRKMTSFFAVGIKRRGRKVNFATTWNIATV